MRQQLCQLRPLTPISNNTSLPSVTPPTSSIHLQSRHFSAAARWKAGLMPDTHDPQPPTDTTNADTRAMVPSPLSDEGYHEHADRYMDALHERAEQLQETREDVEVEFAAGVMSITLPPNGTYVINKQPPNKQIWLSSPISGPKRYDWVVEGEGLHEKQGGGVGDWVYLRDGTRLTELLRKEVGISVDVVGDDIDVKKPSTDPVE
ncbi:Frataxin [Teratosphaeria nubilosa]|uniref:ferroxidase n=1 Tax=Teratosphaeria nubilosa TaxID=161662 RepID=A0A6G1KY20_9PEZI|nr:Frataxin [Teratosphaeria nubilosa]